MIKEWLLEWFGKNTAVSKNQVQADMNVLDAGYIDSFGFIDLVSECENAFSFEFTDDDFENEDLFSINGIVHCIENKKLKL